MVRRLWGNRHQGGPQCLQLRQSLLIGTQLQIAVRTPFATIEGNDDWSLFEQVRERHLCAECVGQGEIRYLRTLLERLLGSAGLDKLLNRTLQIPSHVCGYLA